MVFDVTMVTFWMTLLMISLQILSWVMDEFIHWPEPYLLLSATCDEMLSWMIEIWKNSHLVSDSNCNTVNLLACDKITRNMGGSHPLTF